MTHPPGNPPSDPGGGDGTTGPGRRQTARYRFTSDRRPTFAAYRAAQSCSVRYRRPWATQPDPMPVPNPPPSPAVRESVAS